MTAIIPDTLKVLAHGQEPPTGLLYPAFHGDKAAEIIWLQGQVIRLTRENDWLWSLRRLAQNVDEARTQLSLARKQILDEALERNRDLEITLAKVLATGAQSTGQEPVWTDAQMTLGAISEARFAARKAGGA